MLALVVAAFVPPPPLVDPELPLLCSETPLSLPQLVVYHVLTASLSVEPAPQEDAHTAVKS